MAIGDKLFLADKSTVDSIKLDSAGIKVSTDKIMENKTGGVAIGNITLAAANTYQDAVSITGSGFVTYIHYTANNASVSYGAQIIVDGVTYDLSTFATTNVPPILTGIIKFNTSFKLRFSSASSGTIANYKCIYMA